MHAQPEQVLFSVDDYHKMAEVGILQENTLELIYGNIIRMSPTGSKHYACVNSLAEALFAKLANKYIVAIQGPVHLDEYSEPEPDIALLERTKSRYSDRLPLASNVLLIIEVADSSLDYDRNIKMPLYAQAGIPEFWLINLQAEILEIHWLPLGNTYKLREIIGKQEIARAKTLDLDLALQDLF